MSEKKRSAQPYIPESRSLKILATASQDCKGCDLYKNATQAVFGVGPRDARIVFVGEQPGDQEDKQGLPFVGAAGGILRRALVDAGIDPTQVYLTNAVKHFKWKPRGKVRLHSKPSQSEVNACKPWLDAELKLLVPDVIVCLGATATAAVLGKEFSVMRQRGQFYKSFWCEKTMITVHPSSILRATTTEDRHRAYDAFVADLRRVLEKITTRA